MLMEFHGTHLYLPIRYTLGSPLTSPAGLVPIIYNDLLSNAKPLGVIRFWNHELEIWSYELNWNNIWINIPISSKNQAHQLIHYKFVLKFYASPYKRFLMKLIDDPNCTKYDQNAVGTYLHMFWECPSVYGLWSKVHSYLGNVLGFLFLCIPPFSYLMMTPALGATLVCHRGKLYLQD